MITIFHIFKLIGIIAIGYLGWSCGFRLFGIIGAIPLGILGSILGNFLGTLPLLIVLKLITPNLKIMSEEELRENIRNPNYFAKNLLLLELKNRGLNIDNHIKDVLDMLRSDNSGIRGFGWAALNSAFPELADEIKHYRVTDSIEKCIQNTMPLEKYIN